MLEIPANKPQASSAEERKEAWKLLRKASGKEQHKADKNKQYWKQFCEDHFEYVAEIAMDEQLTELAKNNAKRLFLPFCTITSEPPSIPSLGLYKLASSLSHLAKEEFRLSGTILGIASFELLAVYLLDISSEAKVAVLAGSSILGAYIVSKVDSNSTFKQRLEESEERLKDLIEPRVQWPNYL